MLFHWYQLLLLHFVPVHATRLKFVLGLLTVESALTIHCDLEVCVGREGGQMYIHVQSTDVQS